MSNPQGRYIPTWLAHSTRLLSLSVLILVIVYLFQYMGGLSLHAMDDGKGGNDTGRLFNWHPLLMTFAFACCMSEAILTYKAPLMTGIARPLRKRIHYSLHSLALLCITLAMIAVYLSHALKRPDPFPNLRSAHSWMGLLTLVLLTSQFVLGFLSYLYPQFSLAFRIQLGPFHRFLGIATWIMGSVTMGMGFQENATYLEMTDGPYAAVVALPGCIMVLIALIGLGVMFHQVPAANSEPPSLSQQEPLLPSSLGTPLDSQGYST